MNKPMLEDKDKVAKVYNSKGEVCETFSFRDHGNSYLSAAQNYLMQNYDKLMSESNDYFRRRKAEEDRIAGKRDKHGVKLPPLRNPKQTDYEKMRKERKEQGLDEEVEQMDEGNKENKKKKNEYVSNIIKKKLSPEVLPSLKYGRRELKKEEVEQMDEAKGEYGPDSSLHGHPLRDIDAHLKDNGYIHSKKSDTTHHYTRKDGRMVVHVDSKTKKVVKAFLEPIKKLKEEVEQMDEAHKINDPVKIVRGPRKGIEGYIGEIRHGLYKGAPKRYTVFHGKDGATQVGKEDIRKIKEKVEQMDESSGDAPIDKMSHKDLANYIGEHPEWVEKNREEAEKLAHEKTEDLQEKLTSDMSLADVIRDFVHSDNKRFKGKSKEERIDMAKGAYYGMHENKIYTNIISKLEEGRHAKPTPEHIVAQILKHQDYGYKDHEYTFHDGSKLNVTPEKRDKIIRKIQSLTGPGPGKSPEARKKLYDELNTRKGFLHHTGDEPIPVVKLHPMSAQKK